MFGSPRKYMSQPLPVDFHLRSRVELLCGGAHGSALPVYNCYSCDRYHWYLVTWNAWHSLHQYTRLGMSFVGLWYWPYLSLNLRLDTFTIRFASDSVIGGLSHISAAISSRWLPTITILATVVRVGWCAWVVRIGKSQFGPGDGENKVL